MVGTRWPVYLVVCAIFATVVVSGPLVPGADLTSAPIDQKSDFCAAEGNASVTVKNVPTDQFRMEQRNFGAGAYYIAAPDTTVTVENVRGCPILAYRLFIGELGYLGQRLYFLTENQTGQIGLSVMEGTFAPSDVGSGRYEGTLSIRLRGDQRRTVYETNLTVRIKG